MLHFASMNFFPFLLMTALAFVDVIRAENTLPDGLKQGGFAIGPQAYTFNRFTAFEAIEKAEQAGAKCIEFYPGQRLSKEHPERKLIHSMSDEDFAALQAKLAQHHVTAVNYGVVEGKDEAEWRQIFQFAKKLGLYGITTEDVKQLDIIEKCVKEFDIHAGYHEHSRSLLKRDYQVWDPNFVAQLVKDRDPRIGACADTGHWATSGFVPLECLKILKGRIVSVHLKDRPKIGTLLADCVYGSGVCDVPGMLAELKAQGFKGNISVEYENKWEDNVGDVKANIAFVRAWGERNR
ncbi:MAG TPA: sugar phosphate isomerase/epimerase [Verrucomicrobiaceae bacterium]|jgi:sugar phosphate isomerase/epimerase